MTASIDTVLNQITSITLDEMQNVRLMNRLDSKYIASISILPALLEAMTSCFKVQVNHETRVAPYCTQYLDTPELNMFFMHARGKSDRQKIRIRSYIDSKVSFLEVKNKNSQGRTVKIRIPVTKSQIQSVEELDGGKEFLEKNALVDSQNLQPVLMSEFKRITLVNRQATERVTLDFDMAFTNYQTGNREEVSDLLVIELKREGSQLSDFRKIAEHLHLKPISFSKYCIGTVLTNPRIKYNRFKRKWTIIRKMTQ